MNAYPPESCHAYLLEHAPRTLAFAPEQDYASWRLKVESKLEEILGLMPEPVPLNVRREAPEEHEVFREIRFVFTSEPFADVPCHLLLPRAGAGPFPVVICLQGHTSGMHISLGRGKVEGDEKTLFGDRDFALQAVREGYAALALEQRCFGERRDARPDSVRFGMGGCHHASLTALLLGRTMIGERVWDVRRAIDALATFPEVDPRRIACMGNSGGGTITWFAACLEPRIAIAMPSCYVCSLRYSLGAIDHCVDNYLPGFLRYFDLGDLACLIAPRPLLVVAGRTDPIFPLPGVEEAFATIQQIYAAAAAPDRCRLVVGENGHRFYAEPAWPLFRELSDF